MGMAASSNATADYSSDVDENDYSALIKEVNPGPGLPVLDSRDENTPDKWVKRSPTLIRLTGNHPFNAEPPLPRLMHHEFITPVHIHYVRNHGAVPRASWEDWTVEVTGLVEKPGHFTMDQLVNEFPSREFPATLVCAGNRGKEQNMVKKTMSGVNWGAAGVSTSVWRGVPLRALLKRCGIMSAKRGALNVCFEGAEDLPGGGGSKYGTSLKKDMAMDPSRGIMLAYMQNGEKLTPDHGFPVRLLIPGFICGRMVKWLKRIVVTENDLTPDHGFPVRLLIPGFICWRMVMKWLKGIVVTENELLADSEEWGKKPEHIINEFNINSVITIPCHEGFLYNNSYMITQSYTLRGYSYSGGGKKVTRVEVTMDGGGTWQTCSLDHPEKPNKYGRYWCWCFWSLEVQFLDLLKTKEIAVRAWDETQNTQPKNLIWNDMGVMNNCWFRVRINKRISKEGEMIFFEHPTQQPGDQYLGWMEK